MSVLVIAAHPDDEVLGCGGTIARHVAGGEQVDLIFVADGVMARSGAIDLRAARKAMAQSAGKVLGVTSQRFLNFDDQHLDAVPLLDIIRAIECQVELLKPRIVYTHHAGDLNRDHQIVHQAALTALRPLPGSTCREIYSFEVISSTEWGSGFHPNHFVDIDCMAGEKTALGKKFEALRCYEKEMRDRPHARCWDAVTAQIESRGFACGRHGAEAFMTIRTIR